jgi:hypothetical protein
MSLEEWQVALRRTYSQLLSLEVEAVDLDGPFGEYRVTNPQSKRTYSVMIRGPRLGENRCECPDYRVNTLGTCKHIEYVVGRIESTLKGRRALVAGCVPKTSEVWLQYGFKRQVVITVARPVPRGFLALVERFFDRAGVLRPERYRDFGEFLAQAVQLDPRFTYRSEVLDFLVEASDREERSRRLEGYDTQGLLKHKLMPYQKEGVLFAARAGRALLADDMGLGKTIQALGWAELMAREFGIERVLIVCPASLKYQWEQEIRKFTARSATVIRGGLNQRLEGYREDTFFKIVNYDVIHRDLDAIGELMPDAVILDEAQRIKNWKTRAAQTVKSIRSPYALVLTGTPLENRLEELHSIVSFVDLHRLGPTFRFLYNHQITDEAGKITGYKNLSAITQTLSPILLRRHKKDVLTQLPPRMEKNFFVPMTPQQMAVHDENKEIVAKLVAKWRRQKFLTDADQRRLMVALQYMRMVCDSTWLVDKATRYGDKVKELLVLLDETLEDPSAKVVIFSQWQRMHDLVVEALEAAQVPHVYLHGGVPSEKRSGLVQAFTADPAVRIFLSTDAGGTGLNLQAASTVINLDLPWNPAVLEQRIARAHRMGQQRSVTVVNFVAEGSIEHGMLSLLSFKKKVAAGILDNGDDVVHMEGSRLRQFIRTVEEATGAIPDTEAVLEEAEEAALPSPQPTAALPAPTAVPQLSAPSSGPSSHGSAGLSHLLSSATQLISGLQTLAQQGGGPRVERDAQTGQASVRIPLGRPEDAEQVEQLLPLVATLAQAFAAAFQR